MPRMAVANTSARALTRGDTSPVATASATVTGSVNSSQSVATASVAPTAAMTPARLNPALTRPMWYSPSRGERRTGRPAGSPVHIIPRPGVLLQQVVRKAFLGLAKPYLIKTTAGHLGIAHHHGVHVGAAQPGRRQA